MKKFIYKLKDISEENISLFVKKSFNLAFLSKNGFMTPNTFLISNEAYRDFINNNDLDSEIAR